MTAPHDGARSDKRKSYTPEPTCLPCGNKIPGFADAIEQARADGAAEALAPVLALADEFRDHAAAVLPDDDRWDDGWRAAHRKVEGRIRAVAQAGEVRR